MKTYTLTLTEDEVDLISDGLTHLYFSSVDGIQHGDQSSAFLRRRVRTFPRREQVVAFIEAHKSADEERTFWIDGGDGYDSAAYGEEG